MNDSHPLPSQTGPAGARSASQGSLLSTLAPSALEVAGWMIMLSASVFAFLAAGTVGPFGTIAPDALEAAGLQLESPDFGLRSASLALLGVFVLGAAGAFVPNRLLGSLATPARSALCGAGAIAAAAAALVQFFLPSAWLSWVIALLLGLSVSMYSIQTAESHRKPWRTAGIAAAALLFLTYGFQIVGGHSAGVVGVRWYLLLGAILLLLAGTAVVLVPTRPRLDPVTGAFPKSLSGAAMRAPDTVRRPWACYLLFGALGAVFALALPAVADEGFGAAGFAVVLCAGLLGWAIGYAVGPTFAPGMTRSRLTSFTLLGAGVLLILLGAIEELSGRAVLSGAIAFTIGVGVRSQRYVFSRRVGFSLGVLLALLIVALGLRGVIPLSGHVDWELSATEAAYHLMGISALVAGIVALFTFSQQGIQGIGVDIVHAFRAPVRQSPAAAAPQPAAALGLGLESERLAPHGIFIALEGGDGAGKSTQLRRLEQHLRGTGGRPVLVTREPGGTPAGKQIRAVVLDGDGVSPRSEALLFAADRAHHIATLVGPALRRDEIVLTDRYIDSSLSYQAAGRDLSADHIAELSRWATEGLVPHLTIIIDVDPQTAAARMAGREEENHLDRETLDFRHRVRQAFLDLAQARPSRYAVIDGNRELDAVAADIAGAVDSLLSAHPRLRSHAEVLAPPADGDRRVDEALSSDRVGADAAGTAAAVPAPGEEETRVLSAAPPVAHTSEEDETQVIPALSADAVVHSAATPEDSAAAQAATADYAVRSGERLRAQAELERQARERLRQIRQRRSDSEPGAPGHGEPQSGGPDTEDSAEPSGGQL